MRQNGVNFIWFLASFAIVTALICLPYVVEAGPKVELFSGVSGTITPTVGTSFEVTDPSDFKCVRVEGLVQRDHISLVRQNYAADGWELVTDGNGTVQLNVNRRSACPAEPGVYALSTGSGTVDGTIRAYTEEKP